MTAPQNPIARAIWDGALPIKFSLDTDEAEALGVETIEPYFIEAPRCSYFPLLTSVIRKYFRDMAMNFIVDDAEIWYDVDGTPLKCPPPLPWSVTVHFKDFPADKLIRAQAIDATQDFFMSMIKEVGADFLRNGTTKKVMNLSKNDQTQLWDGLWSKDYDKFWSVNYRLVINDGQVPRHIPLRIYLPDNCPVIQEAISPLNEDDIPIVWASQNLCYPDNFLHIVVLLGL
ncbi:17047_t:CDS:2 [Entrophospora sp. SA101]|nr:17047_t:CDS:2 [Entrophospora sp. SA101]CAJ0825912.1 7096_t:CDS:2 [Entrophospora sp. SA101]CAJ0838615.1 5451_t:CDS:2 [Entrophospora sp. SA101]